MALTGTFKKVEEMDWNGKPYVVVELEYNGRPWRLSSFDFAIIDMAKSLEKDQNVEFETKKNKAGKTNLKTLNGAGGGGQEYTPKSKGGTQKQNGDVNWEELGYQKAMWTGYTACLAGGLIKGPEDIDTWMEYHDRVFWRIKQHKYMMDAKDAKDGEFPF